jgi:hypothetical protein
MYAEAIVWDGYLIRAPSKSLTEPPLPGLLVSYS